MDTKSALKCLFSGKQIIQAMHDFSKNVKVHPDYAPIIKKCKFVKGTNQITKRGKDFKKEYTAYNHRLTTCLGWYLVLMVFFVVWAILEIIHLFSTVNTPNFLTLKTILGDVTLIALVIFAYIMVRVIISSGRILSNFLDKSSIPTKSK